MRKHDNSKASAGSAPVAEPAAAGGSPPEPKRVDGPRDGLVLLCIIIVSAAISVMLFTQFGLSLPASALAGAGGVDGVHAHSQAGSENGTDRPAQGRTGARPRHRAKAQGRDRVLRHCRRLKLRPRTPSIPARLTLAPGRLRPTSVWPMLRGQTWPDRTSRVLTLTRPDVPPADAATQGPQASSPDRIDLHMQPFTASGVLRAGVAKR